MGEVPWWGVVLAGIKCPSGESGWEVSGGDLSTGELS